ncbi:MAG: peptide ABC transporter substrate-binding protein [Gemmatimonadota bacterium]
MRNRALFTALLLAAPLAAAQAQEPLRVFISVDMEGIGGVGTPAMTSSDGKDYGTARRLMTDEVNAVVSAVFQAGPAEVVVNDSHGDHQNVLHTELDPRVTYIQGSIKPLGMVAGLDASFDAVVFLGYHAKAGDPTGFLAHTGTGSVKGLWLNDVEVGEAGMNAAFAGMHGVPVVLASGDEALAAEIGGFLDAERVVTKTAVTPSAAALRHPQVVRADLAAAVGRALDRLRRGEIRPWGVGDPVRIRMRFTSPTHVEVLQAIPGMSKVDGYTVAYTARDADEAYRLIRLMYRFVQS